MLRQLPKQEGAGSLTNPQYTNRLFYENHPRMGMMTRQLDKMPADKLAKHRDIAAEYREKIHNGWEDDSELF